MNPRDFATYILPKTLQYKLSYNGLIPHGRPMTLTFSVTNVCNSRCKSCNIWQIYDWWPERKEGELSLGEIERIFKSMGHVYFFNISGGEPFYRKDLPDIVELAVKYLRPRIIHSPTNALMPKRIEESVRRMLEMFPKYGYKGALTIKPSIDGVGQMHDELRGIKGNWNKLLETVQRLKAVSREYPNLHVELGTVVSNMNKHHLDELEDVVHRMGVESYRNEIAEQRAEFYNVGDDITPSGEEYIRLMKEFSQKIRKNLRHKRRLTRVTEALRLVYYDLAGRIVSEGRQVIPCYAGISNVHLTPYGKLWSCCVLGDSKPMGDLREQDYDFWKVFRSAQADAVRKSIKNRECACPLANQWYSNIVINYRSMTKAVWIALTSGGLTASETAPPRSDEGFPEPIDTSTYDVKIPKTPAPTNGTFSTSFRNGVASRTHPQFAASLQERVEKEEADTRDGQP